ncbi:TetR/AcrR family transcriptional regulator [Saccharopolyspora gloriosae]|uniref:AcrR family transcriptional regulator n=1 Tax=Saccharopolyspora gloriosae TaxID=455344 RepID=A0A840NKK6_9PSEU|nr:TetR/AcrR family transcriptional regulator [Saccharopolyspora gloriosae]MBB5071601.1 AcrR family transcriptional regulator [Saccharopolyspora gloriosae]
MEGTSSRRTTPSAGDTGAGHGARLPGGTGAGPLGGSPASARDRILSAAGELFAESGFAATPTSRIAERAQVPKGLIHYYFRRKPDLLVALVERLPAEQVDADRVVIAGDLAGSLGRLVDELDRECASAPALNHLLWREADTHSAVRRALRERFRGAVEQVRQVVVRALPERADDGELDTAAVLLARAVDHRHAVTGRVDRDAAADREIDFIARALQPHVPRGARVRTAGGADLG